MMSKTCSKCSEVLGEKELVASPKVVTRKASASTIQEYDSFAEDDSKSFVMVEKRSEDVKRKLERELKRELFTYIYWEKTALKHALCKTCVDYIINKQLKDDTNKLKEKQEAAEEF